MEYALIAVENLVKSYGRIRAQSTSSDGDSQRSYAINDVSFTIERGELFTLLGPSGCGKTTTLRSIAGLETPEGGSIEVGGRTLFDYDRRINLQPNKRRLGMAFQSYAIWPHMTVFQNVAFPLKVLARDERPSKPEREQRVMQMLELAGLADYAKRPATKLSGGQQQRIALARALVTQPDVLLLDEPLSNLDARLRETMRHELKEIQSSLGVTSIYVTHDQAEALSISTRVAVMNEGRVVQVGTPYEIYSSPADRFVAEFVGTSNLLTGSVVSVSEREALIGTRVGQLRTSRSAHGLTQGAEVLVAIRPEDVEVVSGGANRTGCNVLTGTITKRSYVGSSLECVLDVAGVGLQLRCHPSRAVDVGQTVAVTLAKGAVSVVPAH